VFDSDKVVVHIAQKKILIGRVFVLLTVMRLA